MSRSKRAIWYNPDHDFIGATGVDSVKDLAFLAAADPEIAVLFEPPQTPESIEDEMWVQGVDSFIIPAAHVRRETYDTGHSWSCRIDDRPGRGYVKIVGVHP